MNSINPGKWRAVLWMVLTVSVVVNVITGSLLGGYTAVSIVAGCVAVACIGGLIVSHVRGRKA
ncbi:hypothetical protein ACIBEJ_43975 [Nonomuraea sp. NPDC050790]|uniref:hypothetical protein n=1 Tax=Nonomuraea sp. NPDC050790 TaxID=3364371 RepID=UPI0037B66C51